MIGKNYWNDDQQVQCPSDADCAALTRDGYLDRLMLAQDVRLKMVQIAFGGNGYAHVPRHVLPRLLRAGSSATDLDRLVAANPAAALCAHTAP